MTSRCVAETYLSIFRQRPHFCNTKQMLLLKVEICSGDVEYYGAAVAHARFWSLQLVGHCRNGCHLAPH